MGLEQSDMEYDEREDIYGRDEYYWGKEPSSLAPTAIQYVSDDPTGKRLLDLGAGEGRDSVFFAERGFDVTAVDISPAGLGKAERLADERGVQITTVRADANELELSEPVDVLYSSGVVQFIRPDVRSSQFEHFQTMTRAGGLHVIFAFVDHPDIPPAPDTTDDQILYERDELQGYYADWTTEYSEERILDDDSGGVPHQHAARYHVARAPSYCGE